MPLELAGGAGQDPPGVTAAGLMGQGISNVRDKLPPALGGKSSAGAGAAGAGAKGSASQSCAEIPPDRQFTADETIGLLKQLAASYSEDWFQRLLRHAEALHPRRGQRGHTDAQKFLEQLHGLLLHVFRTVFPRKPWGLAPGWEGYRQFLQRTIEVAEDPTVVAAKEECNMILGLPKKMIIRPPAEEPVFSPVADGSGNVHQYPSPLLTDADGDRAHEFWEEDRGGTGDLRQVHPAASPFGQTTSSE